MNAATTLSKSALARAFSFASRRQVDHWQARQAEPDTHHLPLDEVDKGYDIFNRKKDDCVKVVLRP